MKKPNQLHNTASQASKPESNPVPPMTELNDASLALVSGGVPCGYLGTHDYVLKMSYANRNYSC